MEYRGRLYGKIGGKHFKTGYTTKDWDEMEAKSVQLGRITKEITTLKEIYKNLGEIATTKFAKELCLCFIDHLDELLNPPE